MRTKWSSSLILSFALAGSTWGAARGSQASASNELGPITIHVYDYGHAKPSVLMEAERAATTILEKAGVKAVWLGCPSDDASSSDPACTMPGDPTHLTLRLLSDSTSKLAWPLHRDTLGFAELGEPFNCNAWILYDQVKEFSRQQQLNFAPLLGGVIAHELGHLLLSENVHADAGLMHRHWSRGELCWIESVRLSFSDTESQRIQSGVIARLKAASVIMAEVPSLKSGALVN